MKTTYIISILRKQFKKEWRGSAASMMKMLIFALFFLTSLCGAFANVTITAPSLVINTCTFPSGYYSLNDIVISEGNDSDFLTGSAQNTDYTFTITAPANFQFLAGTGSTATSTLGDITTIAVSVTATTITVTYRSSENPNRTNENDIVRISGIQIRAIVGVASQSVPKTAETLAIAGFPNGSAGANLQSVLLADNCLLFDNFDDYAEVPDGASLDLTTAVTLEAWIYPTAWKANVWEGTIINKEDPATTGYMLRCGNNGTLSFNLGIGGAWQELVSASGALTLNTWQHVAGVYDGSNMFLYINGAQVATRAQTGNIGTNNLPVRMGAWAQTVDRLFPGRIDEARIWGAGLSACTIYSWFDKPVNAGHPNWGNLVGYYEMNNTTAGVLTATVGSNGTLYNGPVYMVSSNASFYLCGGGSGTGLTAAQPNTSSVSVGSTSQEIIRIEVEATGTINATEFKLRTDGCTNVADIANAKLWYTGTSATFATTTQFGATIAVPPAAGIDMTFSGTQALTCGKNYFWLTYDITAGATLGDVVDAQLQSAIVNGSSRTPSISAPAGSRPIANTCNHTIRLTDTFGDGWNGGTVNVTVNGTAVLTNITLAAGFGPQDFSFPASTGDIINVTRTAGGSFPTEMRIEVLGGTGLTLLAIQEPANAPGTNVTACCAPSVPGLATYTSPVNGATGINVCGASLSWTAPVNTGCNAATSYDIYFGTAAIPPFVLNTASISYSTGLLAASTTYYWKVVPRNVTGPAVGAITWSFTTSGTACTSCTHTIRLTDTYGDGWNGGTVTVYVNGAPVLTNIALAGLTGPEDFTFSAADGDVINVTRTADGSYPSEMRVEILGGGGMSLLPIQQPLPAPGTNVSGCCTPALPGCASNPNPANGAIGINPCSLDFTWAGPVGGACSGATSYDMYFGTTNPPPFLINRTTTSYSFPNALADNTTYYWKIVPKNTAGDAAGCTVWSFTTGTTTNPVYCFYGSTSDYPAGGSNCAQLTPNIGNQNGCAWNRGQISFGSAFDYSVNMYFGAAAGGADGCAFVFQNSPNGISQCGTTGGQLGAGGISNAVVIEFDTYDNDFPAHIYDMAVDHTAIEIDGNMQGPGAPLCGPVQADPLDGLLADGLLHNLRVTWDPATQQMCVYVDASQRLCCTYDFINNVFGGNSNVYWGFTASTGALANQQYFCPITIPLPVTLTDFSISCSSGTPLLEWYTVSESNNDFFIIERSKTGRDFEEIARINGAGNSNELLHYSFQDPSSSGAMVYYRISQQDYDGKIETFPAQTIECGQKEPMLQIKFALSFDDMVIAEIDIIEPGSYQLQIVDATGQIIATLNRSFDAGRQRIELPVPPLGQGLYMLIVGNDRQSDLKKFIAY